MLRCEWIGGCDPNAEYTPAQLQAHLRDHVMTDRVVRLNEKGKTVYDYICKWRTCQHGRDENMPYFTRTKRDKLESHLACHHRNRQFVCKYCAQSFSRGPARNKHELVHTAVPKQTFADLALDPHYDPNMNGAGAAPSDSLGLGPMDGTHGVLMDDKLLADSGPLVIPVYTVLDFLNDVWTGPPFSPLVTCLTPQQVAVVESHVVAVWDDDEARIALLRTPLLSDLTTEDGTDVLGSDGAWDNFRGPAALTSRQLLHLAVPPKGSTGRRLPLQSLHNYRTAIGKLLDEIRPALEGEPPSYG